MPRRYIYTELDKGDSRFVLYFAGRSSRKLVLTHMCSTKHTLVWQDEVVAIPTWPKVINYLDTSGILQALRRVCPILVDPSVSPFCDASSVSGGRKIAALQKSSHQISLL